MPKSNDNGTKAQQEIPEELQEMFRGGNLSDHFTTQELISAIAALIRPGDTLRDLALRGDIPSNRKEGHRWAVAFVHHVAKCREYHDKNGEEEAFDLYAMFPAVEGKRIDKLIEGITAQIRDIRQQNRGGAGNWLKNKAGF